MSQARDSAVKSAARTLDLLEFLAKTPGQHAFAHISDRLGLPKSSLSHLLNTLLERGYVEQKPGKTGYRLGPSALDLAKVIVSPEGVIARVRPLVRELSNTLQATSGYYEARGDYVELVSASSVRHALQIDIPLGRLVPLYATSWGKVLLASFSDEQLNEYIARTSFTPYTRLTVSSGDALRRQMDIIRQDGFAVAAGEYSAGMTGLATALRRQGHVIGSIGIAVPAARYTPEFDQEARRLLAGTVELFQSMTED